ncbi:hypothetical protein ACWHLZ_46310, partial [Streptomyces chartreusis]
MAEFEKPGDHVRRDAAGLRPRSIAKFSGVRSGTRPCLSDHQIVGPVMPLTDVQWARIEPLLPDR